MSLLARVDRLTASSLQTLCFIFGCLLCLSAVILRDGFERTCFHLFKIRRKRASFHVLSALYHKCKKKKKIQERVDKVFVNLFLSCKEPNRQESNLQPCNMRRCRNQSEEAGPSCSGSSWAPVIKCTVKCIQQSLILLCWCAQRD